MTAAARSSSASTGNALLVVVLTVANRGFFLLIQVLAARALGVTGFGLFTIAWSVVGLANVFGPLGMSQAVMRFRATSRAFWRSVYLPLALLTSSTLAGFLLLEADFIATSWFDVPEAARLIRLLAPLVVFTTLATVLAAVVRCTDRPVAAAALACSTQAIALACVATSFSLQRLDGPTLAIIMAYAHVPAIGALVVLARRRSTDTAEPAPWRRITGFGVLSVALHATTMLNLWLDRLALGVLATPTDVGYYQAAAQLAMVPTLLVTAVLTVFNSEWPRAAAGIERTALYERCSALFYYILVPYTVVGSVYGDVWLGFIFGAEFARSGDMLAILLAGALMAVTVGPSLALLHFGGAVRTATILAVCMVVGNLVLNVLLIGPLGGVGAAIATAAAQGVAAGVGFIIAANRYLTRLPLRALGARAMRLIPLIILAFAARHVLSDAMSPVVASGITLAGVSVASLIVAQWSPLASPHDDIRNVLKEKGALRRIALNLARRATLSDRFRRNYGHS